MRVSCVSVLTVLMLASLAWPAGAETRMRLGTNLMPPYTVITDDRQLGGEATHTLNCVFEALPDYRYESSIAPWPRVVRLADQGNIDGWFLYVRNAPSDEFATLSEPLELETWYWYSHQPIANASLSDFRDDTVLVLSGTYQQLWLSGQGFNDFLTVQSHDSLVRAFLARRADHLLISDAVFEETLADINGELDGVDRRFVGYIQLGLYVTDAFLNEHPDFLDRFNEAAHACRSDDVRLTETDRATLERLAERIARWKDADWLRSAVRDHNEAKGHLTEAEIERRDQAWIAEVREEDYDIIAEMLSNETSIRLDLVKQQANGLYSEIFVTGRQGLNLALSDPTTDLYQGDEAIFTAIADDYRDLYIGPIDYDRSSRTFQVKISQPVRDEHGQFLGVVVVGVDVEKALRGFK